MTGSSSKRSPILLQNHRVSNTPMAKVLRKPAKPLTSHSANTGEAESLECGATLFQFGFWGTQEEHRHPRSLLHYFAGPNPPMMLRHMSTHQSPLELVLEQETAMLLNHQNAWRYWDSAQKRDRGGLFISVSPPPTPQRVPTPRCTKNNPPESE